MQDKKILAVLTADSDDSVINTFITNYARGRNIDMTLCTVHEDATPAHENYGMLDSVSTTCTKQAISMRVAELHADASTAMRKRAPFADLVLISKDILRGLALRDELPENCSSIIALPADFKAITNVILLFDGSTAALKGIKDLFQAFSRYTEELEVTLLRIEVPDIDFDRDNEVLLVEYLRQYSDNVGVLKVEAPLNNRAIRALPRRPSPIVMGTLEYLISQYGEDSDFKPFFDNHSTLFIPATNL